MKYFKGVKAFGSSFQRNPETGFLDVGHCHRGGSGWQAKWSRVCYPSLVPACADLMTVMYQSYVTHVRFLYKARNNEKTNLTLPLVSCWSPQVHSHLKLPRNYNARLALFSPLLLLSLEASPPSPCQLNVPILTPSSMSFVSFTSGVADAEPLFP